MSFLNEVKLIWNISTDLEMKQTSNWNKYVPFNLATTRTYKSETGEVISKTDFHKCVIWWNLWDVLIKYANKGKKIYVSWRLSNSSWEKEDGSKGHKTEIIVDNLILLGSKSDGNNVSNNENSATPKSKTINNKKPIQQEEDISIEDIPF